jgi:hypothetical protein
MNCRMPYFILLSLIPGVLWSSGAQAVVVLQPNEANSSDTFIYQGTPDANLDIVEGGAFFGSLLGVGQTSSGHTTESLLKFDLDGVGLTGAQVASATLSLRSLNSPFGVSPSGANPVLVDLFALTSAFVEDDVTWNSGVPGTGALYTQTSVNAANATFNFDVTGLVKDWLNNTIPNHGLFLKGNAPVPVASTYAVAAFASSSNGTNPWPMLTIVPVPEPSSVVLAATALAGVLFAAGRRAVRRRN